MEQYYFTEEGKKYALKSASKVDTATINVGDIVRPRVTINNPDLSTDLAWQMSLKTERKIIPILFALGMSRINGPNEVDIITPFYGLYIGNPSDATRSVENQKSIIKSASNSERQFFSSDNGYNITLKYGQCVYSESDFLNPAINRILLPMNNLGSALTGTVKDSFLVVPPADYQSVISMLYFELQ